MRLPPPIDGNDRNIAPLAPLPPLITVYSRQHGILELVEPSLDDFASAEALSKEHLASRAFTGRLLARLVAAPRVTAAELLTWSDGELGHVAVVYLRKLGRGFWPPPRSLRPLDAFPVCMMAGIEDTLREMSQLVAETVDLSDLWSPFVAMEALASSLDASMTTLQAGLQAGLQAPLNALQAVTTVSIERLAALALPDNRLLLSETLAELGGGFVTQMADAFRTIGTLQQQQKVFDQAVMVLEPTLLDEITRSAGQLAQVADLLMAELRDAARQIETDVEHYLASTWRAVPLFDAFPSLDQLVHQQQEVRRQVDAGIDVLEAHGLGFSASLWSMLFLRSFASLPPRTEAAIVTHRITAALRHDRFAHALEATFSQTKPLRRRWPQVESGLNAHRAQDYAAAIPLLQSLVEGLIGDICKLRRFVRERNYKLYVLDAAGKLQLNKQRKPIDIHGIHQLLDHTPLDDLPVLKTVEPVLRSDFAPMRNRIAHGRAFPPNQAKLSAQCLLLLYILAQQVGMIERAMQHPGNPGTAVDAGSGRAGTSSVIQPRAVSDTKDV